MRKNHSSISSVCLAIETNGSKTIVTWRLCAVSVRTQFANDVSMSVRQSVLVVHSFAPSSVYRIVRSFFSIEKERFSFFYAESFLLYTGIRNSIQSNTLLNSIQSNTLLRPSGSDHRNIIVANGNGEPGAGRN